MGQEGGKIDGHRLCDVFLVAREIVDRLHDNGVLSNTIPLQQDGGVIAVVEQLCKPAGIGKIELFCHDWRSQQFHSALFRYQDRAEIHYSALANRCWKRFAICKEVMHLLLDKEPQHFTTDVTSLIEKLILGEVFKPDHQFDSEWMGVVAAMEVLMPWRLRSVLRGMHKAGETDFEIAIQLRVPVKFVHAMLHGNYGKMSDSMNGSLDGEPKIES